MNLGVGGAIGDDIGVGGAIGDDIGFFLSLPFLVAVHSGESVCVAGAVAIGIIVKVGKIITVRVGVGVGVKVLFVGLRYWPVCLCVL